MIFDIVHSRPASKLGPKLCETGFKSRESTGHGRTSTISSDRDDIGHFDKS